MQDKRKDSGGALDIHEKDVTENISARELEGREREELDPDELAKLDATAELSREKNDAYLVESDLEDSDERGPSPGMKDQNS